MGNEVSLEKTPPRPNRTVYPVSLIPLRLRREHPHSFEPQTLILGAFHSDEEWSDCFDAKSRLVSATISKTQPDPDLWNSISKTLAEREAISTIIARGFKIEQQVQDNLQIFEILQIGFRGLRIVADAVFLVLCFLTDLLFINSTSLREKYGESAINDFAKLDNQLPLDLVRQVVSELPSAIKATTMPQEKRKEKEIGPPSIETKLSKPKISEENLSLALHSFCQFYSPFLPTSSKSPESDYLNSLIQQKSLLDCLHLTVSGKFSRSETEQLPETAVRELPFPTAKDIARAGFRFETEGVGEIKGIRFENGTLRLPALLVDGKTETVIRNLMVIEASHKEKPVNSYVRFLNVIVENGDDVAVLRKSGVLRGKLGKDDRVADFIKSLDDVYCTHGYFPIDKAVVDLQSSYEKKMKEYHYNLTVFTVSFLCLGLLIRLVYLLVK